MANWLMDYIEMTEYIPIEFRDQTFLMRELDLKVSNKMSQLEIEIKEFFSRFDKLSPRERQDQYDALLKKCDEANQAASDKIKLADRLHDLVEKSMRLLDQGLEKLKNELIEGDKGYIIEDIERRFHEHYSHQNQRPKKAERKRTNSAMTIFNSNTHDDSTSQSILTAPSTPDYLYLSGGDHTSLTLKGMTSGNKNSITSISSNSSHRANGIDQKLAKARQPILTAIDAAHAVSPKMTNSDKFSGHTNGDSSNSNRQNTASNDIQTNMDRTKQSNANLHYQTSQLSNHSSLKNSLNAVGNSDQQVETEAMTSKFSLDKRNASSFAAMPLTSQHDPLLFAASQAINATQSMTSGRRTSSLKASYAAVNSVRVRPSSASNQTISDQNPPTGKVYCKCRMTKHDPNMIACDNHNCEIEWFHYECVGITTPPDGEWYCDDCRSSKAQRNGHSVILEYNQH